MPRFPQPPQFSATLFVLVSFACALVWASAKDPFQRISFSLSIASGRTLEGIAVLAKPLSERPVIIYLHDASEDLVKSRAQLRQLAELDLAAVGIEYNKTNQMEFDNEFARLLEYVGRQHWAQSNRVAWLGYGLGAQRALNYMAAHPQAKPQLLVWLAGGSASERDELRKSVSAIKTTDCQFLFAHGREDEVFPMRDCEELATTLRAQKNQVELSILDELQHQFGQNRDVVYRAVAERIAGHFGQPDQRAARAERTHEYLWLSVAAMAAWFCWWAGHQITIWCIPKGMHFPMQAKVFYVLVASVAAMALAQTILHLALPRLAVTPKTIVTAEKMIVKPEWRDDFAFLASDPGWKGKPVWQLLQHVELAGLQRRQFYAELNDALYREYVLSSRIGAEGPQEWGWRRQLWESFYPRVRKEDDPMQAARTVARYLRERVGVAPSSSTKTGVESAWVTGVTDSAVFEETHVAALRSVGIGARLGSEGLPEIWHEGQWRLAPQPLLKTGFTATAVSTETVPTK